VIAICGTTVGWNLKEDVHNAGGILREWIERRGLHGLSIGLQGDGLFLNWVKQFRFDAIVLMVAEARFKVLNLTYPPVMFVLMVKDVARAKQIRLTWRC